MDSSEFIIRIILDAQSKIDAVMAAAAAQADKLSAKFKGADRSANDLDKSMGRLEGNVAKAGAALRSVNPTLEAFDRKLKSASGTLTNINRNFRSLENNSKKAAGALGALGGIVEKLDAKLNKLDQKMTEMGARKFQPQIDIDTGKAEAQVDSLLLRLAALERKRRTVKIGIEREILDREIAGVEKRIDKLVGDDETQRGRVITFRTALDDEAAGKLNQLLVEQAAKQEQIAQRSEEQRRRNHSRFLKDILDDVSKELSEERRLHIEHEADLEARRHASEARQRDRDQKLRRKQLADTLNSLTEAGLQGGTFRAFLDTGRFDANYRHIRDRLFELAGIDVSPEVHLGTAGFEVERRRVEAELIALGLKRADIKVALDFDRSTFDRFQQTFDDASQRIGDHLSITYRGLINAAINLAIVFSEPLLSSLTAVAGALSAVALAAGQAVLGLAGLASAAVAQVVPALGILIFAFKQFADVLKVAQLRQAEQDKASQQSNAIDQQRANALDGVRSALEGVKSAHEAVTDAQRNLTDAQERLNDARRDGLRQLEDLILAEQRANLAADKSQQAVAAAVATGRGDVFSLALQARADQISARRATQDRARVGGNVNNLDSVQSAQRGVENARRSLSRAVDGVDRANRSLERAQRNLNFANDKVAASTSAYETALGKLSTGQRQLLTSVLAFQKLFTDDNSPIVQITDKIVVSFAEALDKVRDLLTDNKVLVAFRRLATSISESIDDLATFMTTGPMRRALRFFTDESAKNIKPVTEIFKSLITLFTEVARAASPILAEALEAVNTYFGELADKASSPKGRRALRDFFKDAMDPIRAFLKLGGALVDLFLALMGPGGGADAGTHAIERLTERIEQATQYVQTHGEKVRKFFNDAVSASGHLFDILIAIGDALLKTFDPESVKLFADFIKDVVIPVFAAFVKTLGVIVRTLLSIANSPIGKSLLQFAGYALAAWLVFGRLFRLLNGGLGMLARLMKIFTGGGGAAAGGGLIGAVRGLRDGVAGLVDKLALLIAKIPGLRRLSTLLGGLAGKIRTTGNGGVVVTDGDGRRRTGTSTTGRGSGGGTIATTTRGAPEQTRSRRSRVGRALGVTGLVLGAGAVATRGGGRSLDEAQDLSGFGAGLDQIGDIAGSLLSFDFGGLGKLLSTDNSDLDRLREFSKNFAGDLRDMVADRNTKGLRDLADTAKDLAERFPKYGDALRAAADQALSATKTTQGQNRALRETERIAERLTKQGYTINLDVRMNGKRELGDLSFFTKRLKQGIPRSLAELSKEVQDQVGRIDELFTKNGKRTPEWYRAMGTTYKLAIENVKRLEAEGQISAKKANRELDDLRSRLRLFQAGSPLDIGKAFAKQIEDGKGDRQRAINSIITELHDLPPAARRNAAEMAIGMVAKLEEKRPDLKGVTERLTSDIGAEFRGMRNINIRRAQAMAEGIGAALNDIPGTVKGALDWIGDSLNDVLDALGLKKIKFQITKFAKNASKGAGKVLGGIKDFFTGSAGGGFVGMPGERGSDTIPTLLGRGEAVLNAAHQKIVEPAMRWFYGEGLSDMFRRTRGQHGSPAAGGFADGGYAGMAAIPGQGGNGTPAGVEYVNARIAKTVREIIRKYHALVTDGFDPTGTKHKSAGHLQTGTAVDFVPGSGGSWDLIDQLAQWAVKRGYNVLYDGRFGTTAYANHGRGNHLHIDFGGAGATSVAGPGKGGVAGGALDLIDRLRVRGPRSALRSIVQGLLDAAVEGANKKIREASGDGASSGPGKPAPPGKVRDWLTRALKITNHYSESNLNALYGRTIQESGGNPRAINLWDSNAKAGHPSKGLLQTIDSTFQQYRVKRLPNDVYNPVANAAAAIRYMFARYGHIVGPSGSGYRDGGAVHGPGTGKSDSIWARLSKGEHVWTADEVQRAGGHGVVRLLRKLLGGGGQGGPLGYASGGQVLYVGDSLGVGTSPNLSKKILSDVLSGRNSDQALDVLGEKLSKKIQKVIFDIGTNDASAKALARNLKRALKMVGDDRELIVSTVNGPGAGAKNRALRRIARQNSNVTLVDAATGIELSPDGIHATARGYQQRANIFSSALRGAGVSGSAGVGGIPTALSNIDARITSDADIPGAIDAYQQIIKAFLKIKDSGVAFAKFVNDYFGDNELNPFTAIESAIERMSARADFAARRASVRVRRVTGSGQPTVEGRRVGGAISDPSVRGQIDLINLGAQRDAFKDELAFANRLERQVRRRLKNTNNDTARKALEARLQTITDKQEEIRNNILSSDEAIVERQEQMQQDIVQRISGFFERINNQLDRVRRLNSARGNDAANLSLFDRQAELAQAQLAKLREQFEDAKRTGNTELANQLNDQIEELETTIAELPLQKVQEQYRLVTEAFDKANASTDRKFRIREILGVAGTAQAKIDEQIGNTQSEIAALQGVLADAQRVGNQGVVEQVQAQIEGLNNSIVDLTAQRLQASIDEVNKQAQHGLAINDVFQRFANLGVSAIDGVTGNFNLAQLGRTDFAAMGAALSQRGSILTQQRNSLLGLLQQAQAQGNISVYQQLYEQIASLNADIVENTKAIRDNTDAAFNFRVQQAQQSSDFRLSLNQGAQAINTALESLSGRIDQATQGDLLRERDELLRASDRSNRSLLAELLNSVVPGMVNLSEFLGLHGNDLYGALQGLLAGGAQDPNRFDDAQLESIRSLMQAIESGEQALIENTKAIKDLDGSMTQTFSSSLWSALRVAVFNGTGGLLPQFRIPQAHSGALVTRGGLLEVRAAEIVKTPEQVRVDDHNDGGDTFNTYITNPTEVLDTTYVGQKIAWATASAGRK